MGVVAGLGNRLVGRTMERDRAGRALRGAGGVLLAGPQGVGKSSLAASVAGDFAAETGAEVLWLPAATTETPVPFRAFASLAPDIGARPGRQADYLTALQTVRAAAIRRGRERPLLLAVVDAHRLDGPSADLLLQLVAEGIARTVMTIDPARPAPGPIHLLWKEELVERIEIEPLDRDSTTELVCDLLSRESGLPGAEGIAGLPHRRLTPCPGGDVTDAIWRLSRGFPLYARELVREGCRTGRIALRDGVWRLDGELEPGPRLANLTADRLDALTSGQRAALEVVAVAEPFPFTTLLRLVRSGHLDALERSGLVSFDEARGERIVHASHPLIGAVVRRSLPVARATGIGLRLAGVLETEGRAEAELVRVASWRLDAGAEAGADLLLRASLLASARQDWPVAARLAEAAVARRAGAEAVLVLADAYRALRRFSEAMEVLGDEQGETDDQAARAAVLRASILFFGLGRLRDALEVLSEAETRIDDLSHRSWLRAMSAGLIGVAGRPAEAVEMAEKILAEPGLRPVADLTARSVLSIGLSCMGRTERALAILDGIKAGPEAVADLPTWSLTATLLAHQFNGDLDDLEEAARSSYEEGLEHHDPRLIGPAAAALGWAALDRGRLTRAVACFREAVVSLRAAGALGLRAPALLGLAESLALTGDLEGAQAALDEAWPAARRGALLMPAWSTAAAWLAAAQGAVSEALERLDEAASLARADGYTAGEMRALHSAVRLGSSAPCGRLAELSGWVEGRLIRIVAEHAVALEQTDRLGAALDAVVERYAELGLNLYAAEAAAQASRAHESAGRTRKAAASAARSHILLSFGQHDTPPPLGLALALAPPELTRREREVAMLAAGGMPSQAIATRLCLSVRTVETHLARVYAKLGIGGRSELPGALASAANWPGHMEAG